MSNLPFFALLFCSHHLPWGNTIKYSMQADFLLKNFFYSLFPFLSSLLFSTAASSTCSALFTSLRETSWCSWWGQEEASCSAGSPKPTATWRRQWWRRRITLSPTRIRRSALITSYTSRRARADPGRSVWAKCGRLLHHGCWTASGPSACFLCLSSDSFYASITCKAAWQDTHHEYNSTTQISITSLMKVYCVQYRLCVCIVYQMRFWPF